MTDRPVDPDPLRRAEAPEHEPGFGGLPLFEPEQLVGGRYRIVRFVAKGGMGEVYEARDTELRETVALKIVRPEVSANPASLERFRREIQLARRVTHPNVCRIIDIGRHGALTFLTMEMLCGETLAERICRSGRLTTAEALPIVRQLAAALAAAHEEGIVHRDFKSDNVVLVPRSRPGPLSQADGASPGPAVRAVVTDFGLARAPAATGSLAASVTGEGLIVGTPAYMAPEQVEGREVGPAADVYALGLVIYEMVTGVLPFRGESALAIAVKRLSEPPAPPTSLVEDLDPAWEAAVLRCLEREPADRFQSALDVVHALDGEEVPPSPRALSQGRRTAATQRRRRRRVLAVSGIAVLALAAGGLAVRRALAPRPVVPPPSSPSASRPPALPAPAAVLRRSVAVLGFKNLSGRKEADWLSTALSEMLVAELAAGRRLRTVSGENVGRMKVELKLGLADTLAPDTLSRVRANLGADLVVLGSYLAVGPGAGGKVRLDVHVQDTATGETVATVTQNGSESDPAELIARAGAGLRREIALPALGPGEAASARAVLPASAAAIPLYAEGLAALRRLDALGARETLGKAVAADPSHALARSALAAAWSALGWDGRAREEAKRAVDLSGSLSREDRLVIQARHAEATNDWPKAVEAWEALFAFSPDDLEYGVRLASAQTRAGRPKDALAAVAVLRALPPPARDDPRVDLAEGRACQALGDVRRHLALARRAAEKATRSHLPFLAAEARLLEADALRILGDTNGVRLAAGEAVRIYDAAGEPRGGARARHTLAVQGFLEGGDLAGARRTFEETLQLCRGTGDQAGIARALGMLALVASREGDFGTATTLSERSLEIYREIGERRGEAAALSALTHAALAQRDAPTARRRSEEALAILRALGDARGAATVLVLLGDYAEMEGDLAGGRARYEEALAACRKAGDARMVGQLLLALAAVALRQGDLSAAGRLAAEAEAANRDTRDAAAVAQALQVAADVALAEADLPGARRKLEEALATSRETGDESAVAGRRLSLARLALEEGRTADAEREARHVLASGTRDGDPEAHLAAGTLLASALLAGGKTEEAQRTLQGVEPLVRSSVDPATRRGFAVAAARAAPGTGAERRRLEALLEEARKQGDLAFELEARLVLLELETRRGATASVRAALSSLERDARSRGFVLVARKAAKLNASQGDRERRGARGAA